MGGRQRFFPTMKAHLARVKNYVPGKPPEELEREYGIRNAVKLASNENALGPSPKAVQAIRRKASRAHRYPDGNCFYLRKKLSRLLGVSPESLVFGNGSDELLVLAVRAFVGGGDEVVVADPTFLIYEIAAQVEKGRVVKVPLRNFRYDLGGMRRRIASRTKLVFIANPDNPVGTYIQEKGLVDFLQEVPKGVVVVLDEAYYEFARASRGYPDSLRLLREFRNLVVTRTFSKAYGLSGLRIGYAVADPSIAAALNKVREPFNVNSLAQEAAIAALDDQSHLAKTLRLVGREKAFLESELRRMQFTVVDTVTNFVLFDTQQEAAVLYERLLRKGVIVRPLAAWGLKRFLRVTVGKPVENRRFLKALKEVLTR